MLDTILLLLIRFIQISIELLSWAMLVYILASWFVRGPNQFIAWIEKIVLPLIRPFRWARIGMMDFSVLVAFVVIQYGGNLLIRVLYSAAQGV